MRILISRLALVLVSAGTLLLAGCGGGGGGGPAPAAPAPAPTTATLSGVVATGAAFSGATVSLFDRTGTTLGTTTVALDGSYTLTIPVTAAAPLVAEASRDGVTLVSAFPETRTTRLNITPLTNLIAARLAPDGNPLSLRLNASAVTTASVLAKVAELQAILGPLLTAIGDSTDPLTGTFTVNGTGHDKVLDSLAIDIRLTSSNSNIEITVKSASSEPVKTTFSSNDSAPPPISGTVAVADLPPDNIAGLLTDVTTRLTACYAVPLQQRVNGATATSTTVVGTASAVIAPECRTLFLDDDPASFLNNGVRVGRDASNSGAFAGIFRNGATGVVFDQVRLEFLRNNATRDVVFSYRTKDTQGGIGNDTLVARNVAGKLKLVGNQYVYNATVRAFAQDREFLNQAAADYQSTGYDINIANRTDANGVPVFSRVLVTAPNGSTLTFRPTAGRAGMVIARPDNTLSSTGVLRLAAKFKNAATSGTPSQYDTGLVFASPAYTDEQIRAIPEQGVWRLEFVHADTSLANVVQSYRTVSRAPTLAEFAVLPLPQLTATAKAELRTESAATGQMTFGAPTATQPNVADLSSSGNADFWTVPAGAAAPTSVTVFGFGPDPDGSGPLVRIGFDDAVGVSSTARKALINCFPQSASDNHCAVSNGVQQYAAGTSINSVQLFAVSPRSEGISKMTATYYLLPRQ